MYMKQCWKILIYIMTSSVPLSCGALALLRRFISLFPLPVGSYCAHRTLNSTLIKICSFLFSLRNYLSLPTTTHLVTLLRGPSPKQYPLKYLIPSHNKRRHLSLCRVNNTIDRHRRPNRDYGRANLYLWPNYGGLQGKLIYPSFPRTSKSINHIYPTPPLGQDMTQGQFFKRSLTCLNSEFSFS